ncbi:hypothetical protein UACE39S_02545 [Ureibacillus acetophenoni]
MDINETKKIVEAISNSDDYYKNNDEALKRLEQSLEEVELIQKGLLPKKSAREFLEELRAEKKLEKEQNE